ncbi:agamous-like MADS-box protein AGL61 [Benincasa hispida]|uniref:agamous-like MADS-box protein AGL61 n=1 Tax=Benincasa hispida TaxID=102211 RepID=UPI00190295F0|nr:agamous-like MADS-box protein AGL61 [Benincasa hispida]
MDSAAPNAATAGKKKQTKGRQKIEMKKIVNEDDRLITFSKRRSGIYKKASELATLCGAEVGVVVFSPAGKPFSFAHPCIESVANKFLNNDNKNNKGNNNDKDDNNNDDNNNNDNDNPDNNNINATHPLVEAHRRVRINELNQQHNQILSQLDGEKERGKTLENLKKVRGNGRGWWETPTEELGIEELEEVDASFGELYQNVCDQLKQRGIIGPCSYKHYDNNSSMGFTINVGEETIPFNILGNVPSPFLPPPPYLIPPPPPPHFDFGGQHQQHHHP